MQKEAIKEYLIINGKIEKVIDSNIFSIINNPSIYEVIRIIDGVPLFLEEHLNRMKESEKLIGYDIDVNDLNIKKDIKKLIKNNKIQNLNIKLLSTILNNNEKKFLIYNIESFYPPEQYYLEGIKTILFEYERNNPNAKVLMSSFKEDVAKKLKEKNGFEALLVNSLGYITEGSRSNLFFIKEDKVYTASSQDVLMGITRKHIIDVCNKLNLNIIEESIHVEDLKKIDGCFMSGTSVNVLPIAQIDDIQLDSTRNSIVQGISKGYNKKIKEYIKNNKSEWI